MHKHLRNYLILVLAACSLLICFPAFAAETYTFLPLNVDAWVEAGEEGLELKLWGQNNTNLTIGQFTFSADIYDANGNQAEYTGNGTRKFYGSATSIFLPEFANEVFTWDLSSYGNAVSVGNIQILSVKFIGGKTWSYSPAERYSYEADFKWENETMAYGSIELYYDHSIHLFDTSLGSMSRDWYIWSDAENRWVWFSGEMAADCYIWDRGAAIKLVINKNPALFEIKTFNVSMKPFITMRHMGNDEAETVDQYTPDAGRTFVQAEGNWNVALWDDNEFGQKRDWYVWDDGKQEWVWFSNERGPAYKVSEEGTYSIKLVYDEDEQNDQVITFTAQRPQAPDNEGGDGNETA